MSFPSQSQEPPPPPYPSVACNSTTRHRHGRQDPRVPQQPVILGLPASVLLLIHSLLPPESRAALTIVNKSTLAVLGYDIGDGLPRVKPWPMDSETRGKFLQLLDRDLSYLIYCSLCGIIHPPYGRKGRLCDDYPIGATERAPGGGWAQRIFMLPPYHFIHSIMRNYRAGRRDYLELTYKGVGHGIPLRSPAEKTLHRGLTVERVRVVQPGPDRGSASLIWMEQRIFPVTLPVSDRTKDGPGASSIGTVRNLYEIGWYVRWVTRLCNHLCWFTPYPFLLPDTSHLTTATKRARRVFGCSSNKGTTHLASIFQDFNRDPADFRDPEGEGYSQGKQTVSGSFDPQLNCALFHRHGEGQNSPCHCGGGTQFGVVRSCDYCETDFCLTVVTEAVPGSGEEEKEEEQSFLVFTSWKNLGSGAGFRREDDTVWRAHISKRARASGPLWAYTQYGKVDKYPDDYGSRVYRPSIHPETLRSARSDWSETNYDHEPAEVIQK